MTRYIFDNEDILLELDGSNNITARYSHGPGIDEPLIMEKGGASFFYHADGLGSITEITDTAGVVRQQYTYSSFGKIESQLDPNFVQPYTFTGREFDPETELYHYRERQYDWRTGRFTTEDPIRFLGGINFYSYVGNNPVNKIDPSGLGPCEDRLMDCLQRVNVRLLGCASNILKLTLACTTGCLTLCIPAGPAYPACVGGCLAACGRGAAAGFIACQSIAAAERVNCGRDYYDCKKNEATTPPSKPPDQPQGC